VHEKVQGKMEHDSAAKGTRGRGKKADNKVEEPEAEEPTTLPAKLKEKRKRKDESSDNGGAAHAAAEADTTGHSSSASFFILTSAAGDKAASSAAAEEHPEKLQKAHASPNVGSAKRGRPKGSGKSATWIPPTEREGNYNSNLVEHAADAAPSTQKKANRAADAHHTTPHHGGSNHSLLSVVDESTHAAAAAATPASVPTTPAATSAATPSTTPTPAKSARGRPKGVSGMSTWIPPSLRDLPQ
jgi:hypothetical protein